MRVVVGGDTRMVLPKSPRIDVLRKTSLFSAMERKESAYVRS